MINLRDPFPKSTADIKALQKVMKAHSVVPYYGSTEGASHYVLQTLSDFTRQSPTFKACVKDLYTYAFGNNVFLVERKVPGLAQDEVVDVVNVSAANDIGKWLSERGFSLIALTKESRKLLVSLASSGNAYLYISLTSIEGAQFINIKTIPYMQVAYKVPNNDVENRRLLWTKRWDEKYMKDNPPLVVTASTIEHGFVWTTDSATEPTKWETILHIRNEFGDSDFYGEAEIIAVLERMCVEIIQGQTACKISATELIAKVLLAVQKPAPEGGDSLPAESEDGEDKTDGEGTTKTGFEELVHTIRQITTAKGSAKKVSSIGVFEYEHGTDAPQAIKLNIARDYRYNEWVLSEAERKIAGVLNWALELTGQKAAKANIGGNILRDLFNIKDVGTITPIQSDFNNIWTMILEQIFRFGNQPAWANVGIAFPSVIAELQKRLNADSLTQETPDDGSNDPD